MDGKGEIKITGQLGDVMKESAMVAMGYIRSQADKYNIDKELFTKKDIHIHVHEGAVPKDGPSAGITMTLAMISVYTGRKICHKTAMTGEITLHGKVLPIGGLKEKMLAAKNVGSKNILVPYKNEKDVLDMDLKITNPYLRTHLKPYFVFKVDNLKLSKNNVTLIELKDFDTSIDFSKILNKEIILY